MRTLLFGFIAFSAWSVFSTYIYVCHIKGLCLETVKTTVEIVNSSESTSATPEDTEKIAIPNDLIIYFAFDKSDFISGAEANDYFNASNALLKTNQQAKIKISGHTDAVGSLEYNQALGLRRAQTIYRFFISKGISVNRINTESKGEEMPVADNNSNEGRAKNRRTVVTITQ